MLNKVSPRPGIEVLLAYAAVSRSINQVSGICPVAFEQVGKGSRGRKCRGSWSPRCLVVRCPLSPTATELERMCRIPKDMVYGKGDLPS